MGKLKLAKKTTPTNQTKISNFFQKPPAKPICSLGGLDHSAHNSRDSCDPQAKENGEVSDTQRQLREIRRKESEYYNNKVLQSCNVIDEKGHKKADSSSPSNIAGTSGTPQRNRPRMFEMDKTEEMLTKMSKDVVLETQVDDLTECLEKTPDFTRFREKTSASTKTPSSDCKTPDMIPDTPDLFDNSGRKKRDYSSRSFLKSSLIITDGVKKVTPRTKLRAKRLSNTAPVSVNFSQVKKSADFLKPCDKDNSLCDTSLDTSETESPSLIGLKYHVTKSLCNNVILDSKSESFKRGAQSGLSPDPKRILTTVLSSETTMTTKSMVVNKSESKSKRRLCVEPPDNTIANPLNYVLDSCPNDSEIFMDDVSSNNATNTNVSPNTTLNETIEPDNVISKSIKPVNIFKTPQSNAYQLNMMKSKMVKNKIDSNDDDVLTDILQELQVESVENVSKSGKCVNKTKISPKFSLKKKTKSPKSIPKTNNDEFSNNKAPKQIEIVDEFTEMDMEMLKLMESVTGDDLEQHHDSKKSQSNIAQKYNASSENKENVNLNNRTENYQSSESTALSEFESCDFDEDLFAQLDLGQKDKLSIVKALGRHTVSDIQHQPNTDEVVLQLVDSEGSQKTCHLHGFWTDTRVAVSDTINLIDVDWGPDNVCHITNKSGLIVVNPDLLISGTSVVSGIWCMRQICPGCHAGISYRAVLNHKFKGCDTESAVMLYGSIIHAFFQTCLQQRIHDTEGMKKVAEEIVKESRYVHDMYKMNVTEANVLEEVDKYIRPFQVWLSKFVNNIVGQDVTIEKVVDIEENIWSPRYGIKGKIDVTAQVKIRRGNKGTQHKTVPLELKTGKPSYSHEHQGQVTLYTLMMSSRGEHPDEGLLLYLKDGGMKNISTCYANSRGLVQLRNELAYFLHNKLRSATNENGDPTTHLLDLPEPLDDRRICEKCPQLVNCTIYSSQIEARSLPPNHLAHTLSTQTLSHLTQCHLDYFTNWCHMLELEGSVESKCLPAGIWTIPAETREKKGECVSGVSLKTVDTDNQSQTDYRHTQLTFTRSHTLPLISSIGINIGDNMVVSAQNEPLFALTMGQVTSLSPSTITILTDKDITRWCVSGRTFRLDKCDVFSTMSIYFTNVSLLMANTAASERLRRMVIDREPAQLTTTLPKKSIEKVKKLFLPLNKPQKTVVLKALMTKDYILVKGYPGTGKTSTIVGLVKILHALGHSILLTSYTHSAVDNILLKLHKEKVDFVRLGKLSRINPILHEKSADVCTQHITDVNGLRQFYLDKGIIATTCLGLNHQVFTQRRFDVCIIDEASQVLQPACLGPLFVCDKFILVGDTKQLPPVVQSKQASARGMSESLFSRLESCGATFELNLQYRMNKEIMAISNHLTYNGALECGSDTVANQCLPLPLPLATLQCPQDWIPAALSPNLAKSVIFLDTSALPSARESKSNTGQLQNLEEAKIVLQLVLCINQLEVPLSSVGVIAPYRNQVAVIKRTLSDDISGADAKPSTDASFSAVEVNTVDQYQGRDKSIIIISFTKSNAEKKTFGGGELLKDVRRLNVAVTRAQHKLILIGDSSTLNLYEPVAKIITQLRDKQLIVPLCGEIVGDNTLCC